MKPATSANTLFNRLTTLKYKLNKYQTKQLGQEVKKVYQQLYGKLPDKIAINLVSKTGEPLIRTVAVYPVAFTPYMDKAINLYIQKQAKALEAQKKQHD